LIELLIALAVLAVLATVTSPALAGIVFNIRMNNSVNELIHSLHTARQHVYATGTPAAVCSSSDGQQCLGSLDWSAGWLVFANTDGDEPPRVDPGEAVLGITAATPQLRIAGNRSAFVLRPVGLRSTNGTLVWCDKRGAASARAVIISYTGKPRGSLTDASGNPLNCPPE
jgi:type IV fimbrial biogenesis protein FimT